MTSNIGGQWMQDQALSDEEKRIRTQDILRATFKPEFLNRIDDIITFRSLSKEDIYRIISIQIGLIQKRLAERKLTIELTEGAKNYMADQGFSPIYGARPLKRALQKLILDILALKILEGAFKEDDHIVADVQDGNILLRK